MTKKTIISLQNLSLVLSGRKILQDISVSIHEGEFIAILGPNGAGKSTLLKLFLGLLKPTSGVIQIFGKPPTRGNNEIGYVPQHRTLEADLALRAQDVVGFGYDGNKWGFSFPDRQKTQSILQALDEVGMLPVRDIPFGKLSGGQQQSVFNCTGNTYQS